MVKVLQKYKMGTMKPTHGTLEIDVTSHTSQNLKQLSPFYLGPVVTYDGLSSMTMENAWQYSKVYPCHADTAQNPTEDYFAWRDQGYRRIRADRHPMGRQKPLYSFWKTENGYEKLGYIDARKKIYIPLYASYVVMTESFRRLKEMYEQTGSIILYDFDAYDHISLGMSYSDVINNPSKIMGHGFILAMLLDGYITVNKNGKLTYGY